MIKMVGIQMKRRNFKIIAMAKSITMVSILKLLLCLHVAMLPTMVRAEDAALLPNAVQQYFDNNGNPLSSGSVRYTIPSTDTLKTIWSDKEKTTPLANPVILNAAGRPPNNVGIYGDGEYQQAVRDRNNNLIWSRITSSAGGGGGTPTTIGDGDLVGTVKTWAALIAPPQYVFTYGQEVNRADYPEYVAAITSSQTVFCTLGSPVLNGLADTTQIPVGADIEVSCLPAGTTVINKTISTLTVSANATLSVNTVAVIFPWGNGNGTTTINIPDFRGIALVGRNNMGGVEGLSLTSTYFSGNDPNGLAVSGGNQSQTLLEANLARHTHAYVRSAAGFDWSTVIANLDTGGTPVNIFNGTPSASTQTTSATPIDPDPVPFSIVQPSKTTNYIIKISPDTSSTVASGVASISGMTGVLVCGSLMVCTGNTINSLTGTAGGAPTEVQFNTSGSFDGSPNFTWVSPKLTLGLAGSVVGQLAFGNATSGTITVEATTGALGSSVLSLPAATDTLIGKATTDTLTNKTFDTAGTGNSLLINGVAATANTGSGAIARATSPSFVTPNIGVATATSLITASIYPPSDSTTALQIFKADGSTRVMAFDTTNARVGINKTPGAYDLDVNGAVNVGTTLTFGTLSPTSLGASTSTITGLTVNNSPDSGNDYYLYYSAADGAIRKCTVGSCNSAGAAGVSSFNGRTGGVVPVNGDYGIALGGTGTTNLLNFISGLQPLKGINSNIIGINTGVYSNNYGTATFTVTSAGTGDCVATAMCANLNAAVPDFAQTPAVGAQVSGALSNSNATDGTEVALYMAHRVSDGKLVMVGSSSDIQLAISDVTAIVSTPGVLTTPAAHGFRKRMAVYFNNCTGGGCSLPAPFGTGVQYFVCTVPSPTTFTLTGSIANANASVCFDTTTTGSGTNSITWGVQADLDFQLGAGVAVMDRRIPWFAFVWNYTRWAGVPDFQLPQNQTQTYLQSSGETANWQANTSGTSTSWAQVDLSDMLHNLNRNVRVLTSCTYTGTIGGCFMRSHGGAASTQVGTPTLAGFAQNGQWDFATDSTGKLEYTVTNGAVLKFYVIGWNFSDPS